MVAAACLLLSTAAIARTRDPVPLDVTDAVTFDIAPTTLAQAVFRLSEQAGIQIVFDQAIADGREARTVRGRYTVAQALQLLLADTGIGWTAVGPRTITLLPSPEHVLQPVRIAGIRPEQASLARWETMLLARIGRLKRYPRDALRVGAEGIVYLRITIDRRGGIVALAIARSDAPALLDAAAIDLVRRAAPLPPPPRDIVGDSHTVIVPVDFVIPGR